MSYLEKVKVRIPPHKQNTIDIPDHSSADWLCAECGLWVTEEDELEVERSKLDVL